MPTNSDNKIEVAEETLKCLLTAANAAYYEGTSLQPSYVKYMVEESLEKLRAYKLGKQR